MSWLSLCFGMEHQRLTSVVIRRSDPIFDEGTLEIILNFLSDHADVFHFASVCFAWRSVVLSSADLRSYMYSNYVFKRWIMRSVNGRKWGDLVKIFPNLTFHNIELTKSQSTELFNSHVTSLSFNNSDFNLPSICVPSLTSFTVRAAAPEFGSLNLPRFSRLEKHISKYFINLKELKLYFCNVGNEGMKHISNLHTLETLHISGGSFSDRKGLNYLFESNLTMLKHLYLEDIFVRDVPVNFEGIQHAKFHLDSLTLNAHLLTEDSVKYLVENSPQLTALHLPCTKFTSSQFNELCSLESVKHLTLAYLEKDSFEYERMESMSLESLKFCSCKLYPQDFMQMISGSSLLKKLHFQRTEILIHLFAICSKYLYDLKELVFDHYSSPFEDMPYTFFNLTRLVLPDLRGENNFECIGNISSLEFLKIGGTFSFKEFKKIIRGNLINLHTLKFYYDAGITDGHIEYLRKCNLPNMTKLDLKHQSKLTDISLTILSELKFEKLSTLVVPACFSCKGIMLFLHQSKSITELTIFRPLRPNYYPEPKHELYEIEVTEIRKFSIRMNKKFRIIDHNWWRRTDKY